MREDGVTRVLVVDDAGVNAPIPLFPKVAAVSINITVDELILILYLYIYTYNIL